ncbi:hypothetical protein LCGC14_2626860 [marine sediment metagenome]|uniref:Uncharacterized protein n=1 Tax=marine sediment metagenome TaxID=412755 RepID=A0A0F9CTZ6_9ZZZZ
MKATKDFADVIRQWMADDPELAEGVEREMHTIGKDLWGAGFRTGFAAGCVITTIITLIGLVWLSWRAAV